MVVTCKIKLLSIDNNRVYGTMGSTRNQHNRNSNCYYSSRCHE